MRMHRKITIIDSDTTTNTSTSMIVPEWFDEIAQFTEKGMYSNALACFQTLPKGINPFNDDYDEWFVIRLYHASVSTRQFYMLSDNEILEVIANLTVLSNWKDNDPANRWVRPTAKLLLSNFMRLVSCGSCVSVSKIARPRIAEGILAIAGV